MALPGGIQMDLGQIALSIAQERRLRKRQEFEESQRKAEFEQRREENAFRERQTIAGQYGAIGETSLALGIGSGIVPPERGPENVGVGQAYQAAQPFGATLTDRGGVQPQEFQPTQRPMQVQVGQAPQGEFASALGGIERGVQAQQKRAGAAFNAATLADLFKAEHGSGLKIAETEAKQTAMGGRLATEGKLADQRRLDQFVIGKEYDLLNTETKAQFGRGGGADQDRKTRASIEKGRSTALAKIATGDVDVMQIMIAATVASNPHLSKDAAKRIAESLVRMDPKKRNAMINQIFDDNLRAVGLEPTLRRGLGGSGGGGGETKSLVDEDFENNP